MEGIVNQFRKEEMSLFKLDESLKKKKKERSSYRTLWTRSAQKQQAVGNLEQHRVGGGLEQEERCDIRSFSTPVCSGGGGVTLQ